MKIELTSDLLTILKVIAERGGTDCSGTCHHRKPGEFHCHEFGSILNISSSGIKNRILKLLRMELLERNRIENEEGTFLIRFTVSSKGMEVIAENKNE